MPPLTFHYFVLVVLTGTKESFASTIAGHEKGLCMCTRYKNAECEARKSRSRASSFGTFKVQVGCKQYENTTDVFPFFRCNDLGVTKQNTW